MKQSMKLAFSGVMAALATVLLFLTGVAPVATLALPAIAGCLLIPVVVERSGIPGETRCNSVTKEQRRALLGLLKGFSLEVEGFRPIAEAIVTSGGVSLKEIDPRTMESKRVPGLYFAGELMDADAYTGGYNLQIAFATGRLAGNSVCTP